MLHRTLALLMIAFAWLGACDRERGSGDCHPICMQGFRPAPGCTCEPIPGYEASTPLRDADASSDRE